MGDRDLAPPRRTRGGGWAELVEAYEAALPRAAARPGGVAGAARDAGGRVRVGAGEPRGGHRAQPEDPGARAQGSRGGRGRSSGSTSPRGASPICSPSTTRSWSWPRARTRSSRSASSWRLCTRRRSSSPTRRCSFIRRSSSRIRSRRRRWRRSTGSTSSSVAGKSWPPPSRRRSISSTDMGAVAELKFRRGAILEQHLDDGAGAVASYREALTLEPTHVGARTALQAYLSSADPALQQAAVEELEPIYEASNDLARLVEVQRIKLAHEKKTDKRVDLLLAYRQAGRAAGQRRPGLGGVHARLRREPRRRRRRARRWRTWPTSSTTGSRWWRCTKRRSRPRAREKLPSALERELLLVVAVAYDEKLGQSTTRGGVLPPRAEHPARGRLGAGGAGAALHPHRALERSRRHAAQEGAAGHRRRRARGDPRSASPPSGRRCWATPSRRSSPGTSSSRRARRTCGRCARSIGCTCARGVPRAGRQPAAPADARRGRRRRDRRAARAPRRAARAAARSDRAPRSRPTRKILELEPEHRETIAALERILTNAGARARRRAAPGADLQDPRRLAAPHRRLRGRGAPRRPIPEQKIALLRQIADGYEVGLDDPAHAYEALGRALAEDPQNPEVQTAVERLARALDKLDDLVARYGAPGRRRLRSRAQERALSQDRAPLRGRPGRRSRRRRPPTARRWRSGRAISRRPTRSSSSICAAATTRTWC